MNAPLLLSIRPHAPLRCAFCHDLVPDAPSACPGCSTRLHPACRAELGRCPTPGCRAAPPVTRPADAGGAHFPGPDLSELEARLRAARLRATRRALWARAPLLPVGLALLVWVLHAEQPGAVPMLALVLCLRVLLSGF